MSSDEQNEHKESQEPVDSQDVVELSLDQLSEAYAQVMRDQGTATESSEVEALAPDEDLLEEAESEEPEPRSRRQKSLEEMDAEDNAGCAISPKSIVESLLFVGAPAGVKLTARVLASAMRDVSPREIKSIVKELNQDYEESDAPFRVVLDDKNYKMKLIDSMLDVQNHFFGRDRPAKLNQSAIDVLAIVAYNQPVSRSRVDKIRARPSGGVLNQLVRRDLLSTESTETPKEILFSTTDRFLELFGLGALEDLPQTSISSDLDELSDY